MNSSRVSIIITQGAILVGVIIGLLLFFSHYQSLDPKSVSKAFKINKQEIKTQTQIHNQPQSQVSKSSFSGSIQKGNYVWGGAMNICWNTLSDQIIGEPLKLSVTSQQGKRLAQSFRTAKFSKQHLDADSYYTKAGYGSKTLDLINKEVKQKFPNKTFDPLKIDLDETDIISYAYLAKQVQYLHPFTVDPHFYFECQRVKGFKTTNQQQIDNIRICKYTNNNQFILKLRLKQTNQQLYVVKGMADHNPEDVIELISSNSECEQLMIARQHFGMPIIDLDIERKYDQLIGSRVLNKGFEDYFISIMFEKIKFKMDDIGAKVENQAVMVMMRGLPPKDLRSFVLDSPFWVVMKQKQKQPYFVLGIRNTQFMTKIDQ